MLFGMAYFVIGVAFGELAGAASSDQTRVIWRLGAWFASGVAFAAHIWYEHFSMRHVPRWTAMHTSLSVAIGAFALAAMANIHDLSSTTGYRPIMLIALIAWPLLTAVPAYGVAWGVAAFFSWRQKINEQ